MKKLSVLLHALCCISFVLGEEWTTTTIRKNGVSTSHQVTSEKDMVADMSRRLDDDPEEIQQDAPTVTYKVPTVAPTDTMVPSPSPSATPSRSLVPSFLPTDTMMPSPSPSAAPSSAVPSVSVSPSFVPSLAPSTSFPSSEPSSHPTESPAPSPSPSFAPTTVPSTMPSATSAPSESPSWSSSPSTLPSGSPSSRPSSAPSISAAPSAAPSHAPSQPPSAQPTSLPSSEPTASPSFKPSGSPSSMPSSSPSSAPSGKPSFSPSYAPSAAPSPEPSSKPSSTPSEEPTSKPSSSPSGSPTEAPTHVPSLSPSFAPTRMPSSSPSFTPTSSPSSSPSRSPTAAPSRVPSEAPSFVPSSDPTAGVRPVFSTAEILLPGIISLMNDENIDHFQDTTGDFLGSHYPESDYYHVSFSRILVTNQTVVLNQRRLRRKLQEDGLQIEFDVKGFVFPGDPDSFDFEDLVRTTIDNNFQDLRLALSRSSQFFPAPPANATNATNAVAEEPEQPRETETRRGENSALRKSFFVLLFLAVAGVIGAMAVLYRRYYYGNGYSYTFSVGDGSSAGSVNEDSRHYVSSAFGSPAETIGYKTSGFTIDSPPKRSQGRSPALSRGSSRVSSVSKLSPTSIETGPKAKPEVFFVEYNCDGYSDSQIDSDDDDSDDDDDESSDEKDEETSMSSMTDPHKGRYSLGARSSSSTEELSHHPYAMPLSPISEVAAADDQASEFDVWSEHTDRRSSLSGGKRSKREVSGNYLSPRPTTQQKRRRGARSINDSSNEGSRRHKRVSFDPPHKREASKQVRFEVQRMSPNREGDRRKMLTEDNDSSNWDGGWVEDASEASS